MVAQRCDLREVQPIHRAPAENLWRIPRDQVKFMLHLATIASRRSGSAISDYQESASDAPKPPTTRAHSDPLSFIVISDPPESAPAIPSTTPPIAAVASLTTDPTLDVATAPREPATDVATSTADPTLEVATSNPDSIFEVATPITDVAFDSSELTSDEREEMMEETSLEMLDCWAPEVLKKKAAVSSIQVFA